MHALVSSKARSARARTLLARAGAVWMWPGIALTERRGAAQVSIAADATRFWISRLHGAGASDPVVQRCLDAAARKLSGGDEAGAQAALDASGLNRLSRDGAALARAVAGALSIAPLDLPCAAGPRLWRAEDIAAHVPLFEEYGVAAGLLAKVGGWEESKHSRVPKGSPGGGQFQPGGGGEHPASKEPSDAGDSSPPAIPKDEPQTEKLRNAFVKLAARWLVRALAGGALGPASEFAVILETAAETAAWLYDKYPYIKAYLDGPKTLEELQRDVGKREKGYEVHHIVEQGSAARDGHSWEDIDGPDNFVRIPILKHWEITGWYMTPNEDFGFLSPREYLKRKSWDERRKVGLGALIIAGVLKP